MIIYILCTMLSIETPAIFVSNNPWDPRDGYQEEIEEDNDNDKDKIEEENDDDDE